MFRRTTRLPPGRAGRQLGRCRRVRDVRHEPPSRSTSRRGSGPGSRRAWTVTPGSQESHACYAGAQLVAPLLDAPATRAPAQPPAAARLFALPRRRDRGPVCLATWAWGRRSWALNRPPGVDALCGVARCNDPMLDRDIRAARLVLAGEGRDRIRTAAQRSCQSGRSEVGEFANAVPIQPAAELAAAARGIRSATRMGARSELAARAVWVAAVDRGGDSTRCSGTRR